MEEGLASDGLERYVDILDGGQRVKVGRRFKDGGNWREVSVSRQWEESLDDAIQRAFRKLPL